MSSSAFSASLDLRLVPSVRALRYVLALHAAAVVLVLWAQPTRWTGLTIAALLLISWGLLRRHRAFGYGPSAISRVQAHTEGGWSIEFGGGERIERVELLSESIARPWLTVLNFKPETGRTVSRVILGDEAEAEPLRRLRARMLSQ